MCVSALLLSAAPLAADFSMQPGARLRPLAADRDRRHTDDFRNFFKTEAAKKSQLDDLRLPWVAVGQFPQRIVYRDEIARPIGCDAVCGRDISDLNGASVGAPGPAARQVHENVPHQQRRHRHEMSAILPVDLPPVQQANKRLLFTSAVA